MFYSRDSGADSCSTIEAPLEDEDFTQTLNDCGLELVSSNEVRWKQGSHQHPRNWPQSKKLYNVIVLIIFEFLSSVLDSASAISAAYAGPEYGTSKEVSLVAFVVLGCVGKIIGGTFIPPYSESIGRKYIYIISCFIFLVTNITVAAVPSMNAVYISRFFMGFTSAIPAVVTAGSIEDIYDGTGRIWAIYIWVSAASFALGLGPIYGAYIAASIGWRWIWYIAAICFAILGFFLLFISESRPSSLLERRVRKINGSSCQSYPLQAPNPDHIPDFHALVYQVLLRPIRLYFTEPIVFTAATLCSIAWALVFMYTQALEIIYLPYGFDSTTYTLAFIPYMIGCVAGFPLRILELRQDRKAKAEYREISPESKIFVSFFVGTFGLVAGLWIVAWTTPPLVQNAPWIASMIGLCIVGFASNEIEYSLNGYLADSYTMYAGSAFAAYNSLRACLIGIFPLFTNQMYNELGANVAGTIIVGVACLWLACPFVFWKYGEKLRAKSTFASFSLQANKSMSVQQHTAYQGVELYTPPSFQYHSL